MAMMAVRPVHSEEVNSLLKVALVQTIAGHLTLWRKGFTVLRDWKIYADFLSPAYQRHNLARLQHLESLGLDLSGKNVLEVGAGIGDHSLFYLYRNCRVLPVEGRARLARSLSQRLGIEVKVVDVDREPERMELFGRFDLVHCYGLLYHLSDPRRFLASAARVADLLLLETCVSLGDGFQLIRTPEEAFPSQALHGQGCRPTRQWIFETLRASYKHVYATRTQPHHPEFPVDWAAPTVPSTGLVRAVFVASHSPIWNPNLLSELPCKHDPW